MPEEDRLKEYATIESAGILLDKIKELGVDTPGYKRVIPIYQRSELVKYCLKKLVDGNNLMLVGKHGVGKTAIVTNIALQITTFNLALSPIKHILQTNPSKLLEGCYYVGNLENKIQKLFQNCLMERTVVFIENIHNAIGEWTSGSSPQYDMIQIINDSIVPTMKIICSTTPEGLKMLEGVHPDFVNKFLKVEISPPTTKEMINILRETKTEIKKIYRIKIDNKFIKELVSMAERFYHTKEFPGKAFDLLFKVADENIEKKELKVSDLYRTIAKDSGLPSFIINKNETIQESEIENYFKNFIFNQDEAIHEIALNIIKFKSGLVRPDRPVGSFLFVGTSGVGKTELAKILAKFLFGSEEKLFTYPMSQYLGIEGFNKLLGTPNSEIKDKLYGTGKLIKDVRSSSFSVLLFDEIDQASKQIINGLYQILDEGRIILNNGDVVSFVNSIIIMSTNVGMEELINSGIGFDAESKQKMTIAKNKVINKLETIFGEPFLNRIDKIIVFNPLDKEAVKKIVLKNIQDLSKKLPGIYERKITINLDEDVVEFLSEVGYSKKYGARMMRRVVEEYCLGPIAEFIARYPKTKNKVFNFKMVDGLPRFE